MWELGAAFAGFGIMMYLVAKADAISRLSEAEADAIRRKADYEFGKETGNGNKAAAQDGGAKSEAGR